jgi:DNA-binding transcriptional ArsR family regulator
MLLPILRSETQARLLAALLLHPEREASIADLAREVGADPGNLHSDVQRLLAAGLLTDRRVGRARLVRAAPGPLTGPLTDLLLVAYGPKTVLEETLAGQPGVERALIVGSWAARYHGEPGTPPHDVDVVVIGAPDRDELTEKVAETSRVLGRDVHVVFRTPQAWDEPSDAFTRSARERPSVELDLASDRSV